MSGAETVRGLVELTRPVNAVAAGVLTFIGAFVAVGGDVVAAGTVVPAGAAVAATVLAVGAGNAINDYFDRDVDAINDPERAIPRGAVSPRGALAFSLALFGLAVACALVLPRLAIAIAVVNLLALVAYTELFKGLPGVGNAVVAYLGGSTFLFGGAAVDGLAGLAATVILWLLAAVSTLTREIIKDVEDVAGDREEGLRTLPIAVGEKRALWIGTGALLVAVAASPVPYFAGTFGGVYLLLVAVADGVMLYAAHESFGDPAAAQRRFKYGTFLAALAFVVGRAAFVVGRAALLV